MPAHTAPCRSRSDSDRAEEWTQRDDDSGHHFGGHSLPIEMDERADSSVRRPTQLRNESAAAVVRIIARQRNREQSHLEHITRICPFHEDRSGKDVAARSAQRPGVLRHDVAQRLRNVSWLAAEPLESGRRVGEHRLYIDDVSRLDAQRRLCFRPVVAVRNGRRRSGKLMDSLTISCQHESTNGRKDKDGGDAHSRIRSFARACTRTSSTRTFNKNEYADCV